MTTEKRAEQTLEEMMRMFLRHDHKIDNIETRILELIEIFRNAAKKIDS